MPGLRVSTRLRTDPVSSQCHFCADQQAWITAWSSASVQGVPPHPQVKAGGHPWGLPGTTPCPKQGHWGLAAQGCAQSGFEKSGLIFYTSSCSGGYSHRWYPPEPSLLPAKGLPGFREWSGFLQMPGCTHVFHYLASIYAVKILKHSKKLHDLIDIHINPTYQIYFDFLCKIFMTFPVFFTFALFFSFPNAIGKKMLFPLMITLIGIFIFI